MVEILYQDAQVIVCCKPAGVLSQLVYPKGFLGSLWRLDL